MSNAKMKNGKEEKVQHDRKKPSPEAAARRRAQRRASTGSYDMDDENFGTSPMATAKKQTPRRVSGIENTGTGKRTVRRQSMGVTAIPDESNHSKGSRSTNTRTSLTVDKKDAKKMQKDKKNVTAKAARERASKDDDGSVNSGTSPPSSAIKFSGVRSSIKFDKDDAKKFEKERRKAVKDGKKAVLEKQKENAAPSPPKVSHSKAQRRGSVGVTTMPTATKASHARAQRRGSMPASLPARNANQSSLKGTRHKDSFHSQGSNRNVAFSTLKFHEHPMILGFNPSTSEGPPVEIAWKAQKSYVVKLERYEATRPDRKYDENLLIPCEKREDLLLNSGYTIEQLNERMDALALEEYEYYKSQSLKSKIAKIPKLVGKTTGRSLRWMLSG